MNKIIAILFVAAAQLFSQAVQLNSFNELMRVLKNGERVRVIIDYSKCKVVFNENEIPAPKAIGGMNFETFEFFDKGAVRNEMAFVSTSQTVLISHPSYGTVLNYVRIKIFDNDSVEITARYLDPNSYEIKMDEKIYSEIKTENNDAGTSLFKMN